MTLYRRSASACDDVIQPKCICVYGEVIGWIVGGSIMGSARFSRGFFVVVFVIAVIGVGKHVKDYI